MIKPHGAKVKRFMDCVSKAAASFYSGILQVFYNIYSIFSPEAIARARRRALLKTEEIY
jgi:hypothetical protein